jgi:hypothetical protein
MMEVVERKKMHTIKKQRIWKRKKRTMTKCRRMILPEASGPEETMSVHSRQGKERQGFQTEWTSHCDLYSRNRLKSADGSQIRSVGSQLISSSENIWEAVPTSTIAPRLNQPTS